MASNRQMFAFPATKFFLDPLIYYFPIIITKLFVVHWDSEVFEWICTNLTSKNTRIFPLHLLCLTKIKYFTFMLVNFELRELLKHTQK
jgi:hypothetical protein